MKKYCLSSSFRFGCIFVLILSLFICSPAFAKKRRSRVPVNPDNEQTTNTDTDTSTNTSTSYPTVTGPTAIRLSTQQNGDMPFGVRGATVSNLSGGEDCWTYFWIDIPYGTKWFSVEVSGDGQSDVTVYFSYNKLPNRYWDDGMLFPPSRTLYERFSPFAWSGRWYIGVLGQANYSNVDLEIRTYDYW